MAGGIFAVLDDVATLLDDVAVLGQTAAKKTAGILGDDLAVNAEKATGFRASRELPVIWAISKGSLVNKLIILPVAFLLSAYLPWLIVPVLLIGGAYLSYEGTEKVFDWLLGHAPKTIAAEESADPDEIVQREKKKIRAAIRTDFILSIEIIIISLETVMGEALLTQALVVTLIALLATVGVYGLVALLVRMDDAGFYLIRRAGGTRGSMAGALRSAGKALVASLPRAIRVLTFIGTAAMLLVGGGMYVHNIEPVHHALAALPALTAELLAGLVVGTVLLGLVRMLNAVKAALD